MENKNTTHDVLVNCMYNAIPYQYLDSDRNFIQIGNPIDIENNLESIYCFDKSNGLFSEVIRDKETGNHIERAVSQSIEDIMSKEIENQKRLLSIENPDYHQALILQQSYSEKGEPTELDQSLKSPGLKVGMKNDYMKINIRGGEIEWYMHHRNENSKIYKDGPERVDALIHLFNENIKNNPDMKLIQEEIFEFQNRR